MKNIAFPDDDRLSFWGTSYQFDHVFEPRTPQAKASPIKARGHIIILVLSSTLNWCRFGGHERDTNAMKCNKNKTLRVELTGIAEMRYTRLS